MVSKDPCCEPSDGMPVGWIIFGILCVVLGFAVAFLYLY